MHPEGQHRDSAHPGRPAWARRAEGGESLWYVTRVRVEDGRPVVDVARVGGPGGLAGVPLLVAGGVGGAFAHAPVTATPTGGLPAGAEVREGSLVRLVRLGRGWAAEAAALPQASLGMVARQPAPTKHQDHPGTPTPHDHALVNGGGKGKLLVDARGEVLAASETAVRLQVGLEGVVRIARDGDASERPALGFALVAYLEELTAWMAALSAQVAALALKTATSAPFSLASPDPTVQLFPDPLDPTSVVPPAPTRALVSEAVHIPSDAVEPDPALGAEL